MRSHLWHSLRDDSGAPIPGADISVYLAGTNIPANIYLDEVDNEILNQAPQLKTNAAGFFEFWIGDDTETYGYPVTQKFKIAWVKQNIAEGSVDYVNIAPASMPAVYTVDETGVSSVKNKTVSNRLAKLWTDHVNNNSHLVHGIEQNSTNDETTTKNKLVSNAQVKLWTPYEVDIASAAWSADNAQFSKIITHNLGNDYPGVVVYNTATKLLVTPAKVESLDTNRVKITVDARFNAHVRCRI